MTYSVLIVEDDPDIADLLRVNLQEMGICTRHFDNGRHALQHLQQEKYSLLLLDIMVPEVSGLDICRQVRQSRPEQAILMLTAKDSEMDRVIGLELGADDYMTKPFSVRELQARVKSQLRKVEILDQGRLDNSDNRPIVIGNLHIDRQAHRITLDQNYLDLTATEFELLVFLARHPNQVFSRAQLLESVWGYHHSGYEHTVNSHINRLRAKVEENPNSPGIIQTVWGVGYKFNPQGVGA